MQNNYSTKCDLPTGFSFGINMSFRQGELPVNTSRGSLLPYSSEGPVDSCSKVATLQNTSGCKFLCFSNEVTVYNPERTLEAHLQTWFLLLISFQRSRSTCHFRIAWCTNLAISHDILYCCGSKSSKQTSYSPKYLPS